MRDWYRNVSHAQAENHSRDYHLNLYRTNSDSTEAEDFRASMADIKKINDVMVVRLEVSRGNSGVDGEPTVVNNETDFELAYLLVIWPHSP